MNICIPKERRDSEYRVGLTPAGVRLLTQAGHSVFIEHDAGTGSGFSDHDYLKRGGQIVYSGEEIYGRADLLLKVARPTEEEFDWMREGQTVIGFLHLMAGRTIKVEKLLQKKITSIGFEIVQEENGRLPVLVPLSQLAGRMIPQVAATLSQNNYGGNGFALGGVPGVPPADIVIIGGGTVGRSAARTFQGMGATVHLLDNKLETLQAIDREFNGQIRTMVAHDFNIEKACSFADVIVGAILKPGSRTPLIVTREMVKVLHPRSIVMDLSIDQGGCFETSRPTSHSNPTYLEEDVIHYCVPNMTGVLGRTATHAMNNASWPFVKQIAQIGIEKALEQNSALKKGVYTHKGEIVHQSLHRVLTGRK
ncbi:MAG: alanine dehydrogenase [Anaerolinea sp. 4484_236]|nr:MAG: alanine dehydrogenase [Anaerolinea sp. 4484_236]OQY29334.1 MAG: alanine dehydrogenase [Anaerolineaceae bacterium 4572_5.2]RLD07656.1 MAG: alanine dehydrogenase [Chloroflexota bacterium]